MNKKCWNGKSSNIILAIALIFVWKTASAESVSIANFSFEAPVYTEDGYGILATGWIASGFSGVWNPTTTRLSQGPTDGNQVGYSNNYGLGLSQTLSAVLTANTQYTLMVDVLSRNDASHVSSTLQLLTSDDILLASAMIGQLDGGTNFLLTTTYLASAENPYLGKTLKIALLAGGIQSDWDNVRMNASPVPVPSTMLLLGSGVVGLLGFGRRNRN